MTGSAPIVDRRRFLVGLGAGAIAAAGLTLPEVAAAATRLDRTLVLLRLAGGNDGLNTVVPYADPGYRKLRPTIGIAAANVIQLGQGIGLHPSLAALNGAWTAGDFGIALGVGYPSPSFSHFRSTAIVETASDSSVVVSDGWAARLFSQVGSTATGAVPVVTVDSSSGGALSGDGVVPLGLSLRGSLALDDPAALPDPATIANPALAFVVTVQRLVMNDQARFGNLAQIRLPVAFPATGIGNGLQQVARVLSTGASVPVIALSHGSYDTHTRQTGTHAQLLRDLGGALDAFRRCMIAAGLWNRVLVMTYAEFGRRAAENGSGGTDHGTANAHLLMGGGLRGGFYGAYPSLTSLANGNLNYTLDFRQLYGTVARDWWGLPDATVSSAFAPFPSLGFIRDPATA